MTASVTAEFERDEAGRGRFHLKIGTPAVEVNVALAPEEAARLCEVEIGPWVDGALRLGRSADAPVHWSADGEHLSLLIGRDDQSWDVAVTLPAALLAAIRAEVGRCRAEGETSGGPGTDVADG